MDALAVHQVAEKYGRSPREVREEWSWLDFCDALMIIRAEAGAREAVQKHHEVLNGR